MTSRRHGVFNTRGEQGLKKTIEVGAGSTADQHVSIGKQWQVPANTEIQKMEGVAESGSRQGGNINGTHGVVSCGWWMGDS
ncbi:hypothetical protein ACO0LM_23135 [Undibacterium sp. Di26W]|uniref:hypothetical protein n=1 Tax=Undibacterium sp. Di26W TaxID=3413035 RepID=UPI003BF42DEE